MLKQPHHGVILNEVKDLCSVTFINESDVTQYYFVLLHGRLQQSHPPGHFPFFRFFRICSTASATPAATAPRITISHSPISCSE